MIPKTSSSSRGLTRGRAIGGVVRWEIQSATAYKKDEDRWTGGGPTVFYGVESASRFGGQQKKSEDIFIYIVSS